MIMERIGGLRSGVPAPEEWSVLRTFRTRSLPLLALNSRLYSKLKDEGKTRWVTSVCFVFKWSFCL